MKDRYQTYDDLPISYERSFDVLDELFIEAEPASPGEAAEESANRAWEKIKERRKKERSERTLHA
jgi:hypothetical protein